MDVQELEVPRDPQLEDTDLENEDDDTQFELSLQEEQELLGYSTAAQPFEEGGRVGKTTYLRTESNHRESEDFVQDLSSDFAQDFSPLNQESSVNQESPDSTKTHSELSGGYHVPIQLVNTGDEPVVLKAGTYVGQLHQMTETQVPVQVYLGAAKDKNNAHSSNYTAEEIENLIQVLKIDELEITPKSKTLLKELIATYANVFAKSKEEIGCVNLMKVGIDVQGHPPIRVKPYRVSPTEREVIRIEVEKMLAAGVIKPSTSAWASPVVLVPKPDGSIRFAIDYRKLNSVTRREVYPMPNIQDFLDALKGNKYFTIADGQQAYFGLPMEEDSSQYTAFICHLGQYDFLRMPFGIMNGPDYYQRLMNAVLQGMLWEECLVYLDDICVMSTTEEQHIERLQHLFERLVLAGIKLKPSKCHLLQKSIKL